MKLTRKFWVWVSQVFALIILLFRADLILELLKLIPNADVSQLYPEITGLVLVAVLWSSWLVWRAYQGFYRRMDFLIDENDYRY
jgi:hypothetical protein